MQIALLGLGKMGRSIVEKLIGQGHKVVVWNRSPEVLGKLRIEKAELIVNQQLAIVHSIAELRTTLLKPRVIWSMLPAGEATEAVLQEVSTFAEGGDIVIDGGNANYKDTDRRAEMFKTRGIKFLGIGVSGGIHGLENGFSLMVGGDQDAYAYMQPLLESLSQPSGIFTYFGPGGSGHFVKMIHNGVEYGMMQAIAEGFGILSKTKYNFNLIDIANTWQEGSIVSSFLIDMVIDALSKDPTLAQTDGVIGQNGEGAWTVEQGKEEQMPVDVIEKALEFRNKSSYDKAIQDTFTAKLVQAMRHEFGGHEEGKSSTSQ
ncbi:MAG TPA: decarboxylating 6-phosphogluconate dehydrogenase [Methylomirabilota bacterium]|nr:decarboxylating 6-phosphogluconate dehydrogenase [Methylomirabilota bacterium]